MDNKEYVTASEIGEYVYCQRAWWLRANGKAEETFAMLKGRLEHDGVAALIDTVKRNTMIAWTILLIGIGLILLIVTYFLMKG